MVSEAAVTGFPAGAAIVPLGDWQLARATGADRISFLHRLLTGKIEGLTPGRGTRSLLLTVKGHIVADLRVAATEDQVWMVLPPGQGPATVASLTRYAVMDDFAITLDADARLLALHGPDSETRLREAGVQVPAGLLARPRLDHAQADGPGGPLWLLRETAAGVPGFWLFGPETAVAPVRQALQAAGVPALTPEQADLLRIRAGEPRFGSEINEDYFPMELGLSGAIDYAKGCYLGQEPIIRIRDRGHLNWRLVTLKGLDVGPVAAGDRLEADTKPKAGRVTSVAALPGQPPVALGMLHMSVPVGAIVRIQPQAGASDAGAGGAGSDRIVRVEVTGEPQDA